MDSGNILNLPETSSVQSKLETAGMTLRGHAGGSADSSSFDRDSEIAIGAHRRLQMKVQHSYDRTIFVYRAFIFIIYRCFLLLCLFENVNEITRYPRSCKLGPPQIHQS